MDLLALLEEANVIDAAKAQLLRAELTKPGVNPEAVFVKNGVPLSEILRVKGTYYGVPPRELGDATVPFEVLHYIPEESARYYHFVPIGVVDNVLEIGITDPDNLEARDALTFTSAKIGMPYKLFLISQTDFDKMLNAYRGFSGEVGSALTELQTESAVKTQSKTNKETADQESLLTEDQITETESAAITTDAPVTKIVATVLRHAFEQRASDIHIEALVDKSRVRFRIDGVLTTNITLPTQVHQSVVARIKVLSNMRLDEKRKPQDGRFSARIKGNKVDFRVSTFPTYYGEKVVMRILGSSSRAVELDSLGFSAYDLEMIRTAIKKSFGMILVSGPTGSGKSTSLYAILNEVDRERQNVLSLEDPVEYIIPGVSQSQMRPEIGYTFASGLRTTLRQDPNIIMVGEIRDAETANLAVQAALTGHLVLSTIHTNNAVGIVPRLLDMGVEPYLIPPVLILGMAQRLVRTLCPGSGKRMPVDATMQAMFEDSFKTLPAEFRSRVPSLTEVTRLAPTPECPTGTKGRVAVVEMFNMSPELEKLILSHGSEEDMTAVVRKQGMLTMKEDAIIKSANGVIPFEEVNALGGEFEIPKDEDAAVAEPKVITLDEGASASADDKEVQI